MLPGLIQITNDFGLECCIGEGKSKNNITGSTKGNFPLPIFQGEPTGRNNEYKSSVGIMSGNSGLPVERERDGSA